MQTIVIDAQPVETIPVRLVGKDYQITPPKSAFAMRIARQARQAQKSDSQDVGSVIDVMDEWIVKAFGDTEAKKIMKRLDDGKDLLDIEHIMELMEKVIEAQSGEHPTS